MFKSLRKTPTSEEVRFCDSCGKVCDDRCLADAVYEQTRNQSLLFGWRSS